MKGNYVQFDFGTSYFRDETVVDLLLSKISAPILLGLWSTLNFYLISIPLGIVKAARDGTRLRPDESARALRTRVLQRRADRGHFLVHGSFFHTNCYHTFLGVETNRTSTN